MFQKLKFYFCQLNTWATIGVKFDIINIDRAVDEHIGTLNETSKINQNRLVLDIKRSLLVEGHDIDGLETFMEYDGENFLRFGAKRHEDQEPLIILSLEVSEPLVDMLTSVVDRMKKVSF